MKCQVSELFTFACCEAKPESVALDTISVHDGPIFAKLKLRLSHSSLLPSTCVALDVSTRRFDGLGRRVSGAT